MPTFGTGKPSHFPTQTSIALSEDIAPAGGNSSIAPDDAKTTHELDLDSDDKTVAAFPQSFSPGSNARDATSVLLERLGIQEPSFSTILEIEPSSTVVMAWS
ncbi:MAG: hypothetical protein K8T10_20450, partial [Candidatus Eremiobacteraeota bacterium]|nr:hypothetical protein [Candidatus Eremiobacteraeota bacterium]